MNGMLQLPQGNDQLYPDPIVIDTPGELLGTVQHSITSRKVRFEVYAPPLPRELRDTPGEWLWIAPSKVAEYGVPSWVAKALKLWNGLE